MQKIKTNTDSKPEPKDMGPIYNTDEKERVNYQGENSESDDNYNYGHDDDPTQ